jgi:hypothetical protein
VSTPIPQFNESKWLRVLRNFLKSIGGQLRLDQTYVPPLQRAYDSYIMDHVMSSQLFTDKQVREINYCRLFLHAVTVSDITNASGSRLFPGILQGSTSDIDSATKDHHVYQLKPYPTAWRLWKRACELFSTAGVLHDTLEEWLVPPEKQRRTWPFYFDPATGNLLHQLEDKYTVHYKCCMSFDYDVEETMDSIPPTAYPVDTRRTFSGWRVTQYNSIRQVIPPPFATTFS